jgi:hypothetical protein
MNDEAARQSRHASTESSSWSSLPDAPEILDAIEEEVEVTAGRVNGRTRPKGYAPWSPRAATRALLECVDEVLDEYEAYLPLTVRQIFYRLVGNYDYDKTELAYNRLGEHLVRARRGGLVPFEAIRDDGVVTYSAPWHEGVEAFWNDTGERIRMYRRDRQTGQRHRVELWCEAAGMAPQLARVVDDYSVPVFSSGGFASLTAVRLIADRALARTVPTMLIHVGDFDPSGESIFSSIAADAAAFVEADRTIMRLKIVPVRVALTAEQVEVHDLPTVPPKRSDSRSAFWQGETCQLEALAPDLLAAIVRDEIESVIDWDVFDRQVRLEEGDRVALTRALPSGESAA